MSFFLCPRTAGTLAGATTRALRSRSAKVPSPDALRWLSGTVSSARTARRPVSSLCPWHARTAGRAAAAAPPSARRTFFSRVPIATQYQELPSDYQDHVGLRFRHKDLGPDEVDQIFGPGVLGPEEGNALLRIMHGRRVAGTLEDPQYRINTDYYTALQREAALDYLRARVPVDETLNAGLRAEEELAALEDGGEAEAGDTAAAAASGKPSRFKAPSLYKPLGEEEKEAEAETAEVDPMYGQSAFDRMRARNMQRSRLREQQLAKRKKEREAQLEAEAAKAGPPALVTEEGKKIMSARLASYYKKAEDEGLAEPERMPFWQRVVPSATFAALAVGFCAALATVYEAPEERHRMLSGTGVTAAQATVAAVIGANVAVWAAWKLPPLWGLLNRYMILVVGAVRPATTVTAVFSHQTMSHLAINMVPLWLVGVPLHEDVGRWGFVTLYVASGAAGYVCSVITYTARGWLAVTSLGGSGALLGIVAAYLYGHRWDGFRFWGLPEDGVHGMTFLALWIGLQLSLVGKTASAGIDLASHMGGLVAGMAGMAVMERLGAGVERGARRQVEVLRRARANEREG